MYDINDRNVLIYRIVYDSGLETINVYSSDEEDDVDNDVVIVLDSDSEAMSEINSDDDSSDGDGSYGSVEINEDSMEADHAENRNNSSDSSSHVEGEGNVVDQEPKNGNQEDESGISIEPKIETDETNHIEEPPSEESIVSKTEIPKTAPSGSIPSSSYDQEMEEKLQRVRARINPQKTVPIITAQPLRKRRKTITEREYEAGAKKCVPSESTSMSAEDLKQQRQERLANIAMRNNAAKAAAEDASKESRPKTTPKVKITQKSRFDMLSSDIAKHTPSP